MSSKSEVKRNSISEVATGWKVHLRPRPEI